MRDHKYLVLVVVAVLALLAALWFLRDSVPPPEPPAAPRSRVPHEAPPTRSPPPVVTSVPAPTAPTPVVPAESPPVAVGGLPLVRPSGIHWATLHAETHPTPGLVVTVRGPSPGRAARAWEGMARAALVLAVGVEGAGVGVRVDLDVGDARPAPEHLAALALGIRLELATKPWPDGVVVASFPAPDGRLLAVEKAKYIPMVTSKAGLRLDASATLGDLYSKHGVPGGHPGGLRCGDAGEPEPARERPRAGRTDEKLQRELDRVLSRLAAGQSIEAVRSRDITRMLESADGMLLAAPSATFDQLAALAITGAEMRSAARVVGLVDERLPGLTARLSARHPDESGTTKVQGAGLTGGVRDPATGRPKAPGRDGLEEDAVYWVTSLVTARVQAESRFLALTRSLAAMARTGPPVADRLDRDLRARERQLDDMSAGLDVLLEWTLGRPRGFPQPYPFGDVWLLAEQGRSKSKSRSALVDYGEAVRGVGRRWATLTIAVALEPHTPPGQAQVVEVKDPGLLTQLLRTAASSGQRCRAALAGLAPTLDLDALLPAPGTDVRASTEAQLEALGEAWRVAVYLHEVGGLADTFRDKAGRGVR